MAEYMGTKEALKKWEVSQSTISRWCRERKVQGAEQDCKGSPWRIPKDTKKPNTRRGSF
ncbi:MAG: DNA-binding protein [Oscillospiraceae bacterium]